MTQQHARVNGEVVDTLRATALGLQTTFFDNDKELYSQTDSTKCHNSNSSNDVMPNKSNNTDDDDDTDNTTHPAQLLCAKCDL